LLQKFGLPTKVPAYISNEDMIKTLRYNKRYLTEGTRMALLSDVGEMWHVKGDYVIPVPLDVLVEAFEQTKAKA
jgi:3-dehydroquinate synthetase